MVVALILKLKQLFFNRKTKVPKGKPLRGNEAVKKRYLIGMLEVLKNLKIGGIKMVILATDLEKVEQEKGTDEVINVIAQTCRKMEVPLVYAFDRNRLGCLAKNKGQKVSCVGVCNFQGANEIYGKLVELTNELREVFYDQLVRHTPLCDLMLLRKENLFLNWEH